MISNSSLTISWLPPDIEEERWEFFNHPAKQEWYRLHSVTWDKIISSFGSGKLVPYPRSGRIAEIPVALSYHNYGDYQTCLARSKRGYRKSYSKMENDLQSTCTLAIKAPIILTSKGDGLLFSGYRRLCLAWNYGMIPYVWLVEIAGDTENSGRIPTE
jgi:hypothetical protein